MQYLDKQASQILDILVERTNGKHAKIDNTDGVFMPVVIERIGGCFYQNEPSDIYSLAHYYEQYSDLMSDPEMTFLRVKTHEGNVYMPLSLRQDRLGIDLNFVIFEGNTPVRYLPREQAENTKFANQWLRNIKRQQNL